MHERTPATVALVCVLSLAPAAASAAESAPFTAKVSRLTAGQRQAMTSTVWRPGCPVKLGALRRVTLSFWGFGGRSRRGALVVHRDVVGSTVGIFRRLYRSRIAIRRMVPIERYRGSDFRSIAADNTSAFNCRFIEGTRRWSLHAYGRAIDINPLENPYVRNGRTSHPRSRPYVRRRPYRKGMAISGGALVGAFRTAGWSWGGNWRSVKDYQHFFAPMGPKPRP